MKKLAIFLSVITLIVGAAFGYYLYSCELKAEYTVKSVPASDMEDLFYELKGDIAGGNYEGVKEPGDISGYRFVTLTANAKSICVFPAEWVTMSAVSVNGDVIIASQSSGPNDIDRFGSDTYTITLLTSSNESERRAILNYYILGRNHSVYLTNATGEGQ